MTAARYGMTKGGMRFPERGLALLRIVVGLWFLKGVVTKLGVVMLGGVVPVPAASERWLGVMPKLLTRYASENPIEFYRTFLLETVIPHSAIFAHLTALGEAATGIGLTFGLFTPLAALLGLWLVLNYGLAVFWQGPSQQGFHVLLLACMVVFFLVRAGRRWGVDAWLHQRLAGAWIDRLT